MTPRLGITIVVSGVVGGVLSGLLVLAFAEGPAGPTGSPGPRGPAGQSAVHGAYVLSDGDACPAGTTAVNAELLVRTNSASGESLFSLCYIK